MNTPFSLGTKAVKTFSKPFKFLFGSDERGFGFLLFGVITLYFTGFNDASIVLAVYSAMFGHSAIGSMRTSGQTGQGKGQGLEDVENMMNDALSMAEDFQDQKETEAEKQ